MSLVTVQVRSLVGSGALAVALAACAGAGGDAAARTPGISGDTIYIGALTPLSDAVAVIGKPMLAGLTAYFDKVNAEGGGVAGKYKVKILAEDITYANPSTGAQKYQKIRDQVALFGLVVGTDQVNGLLPLLAEDTVMAVPTTFDAEWVRNENLLPWGPPYQLQAINGVGHALTSGGYAGKTVCTLTLATGYGQATVEGVEYLAKNMGFTVAVNATFKQDDQEFVAPVTQLKNAGCAVVMLASLPGVTGKVLGTAAQLGYAPRWVGTTPSWHHALAASPIKDYLVKNYWMSGAGPALGDTTQAGVRTMLAVQAKYAPNQQPDFYYYAGYFAGFTVQAVLEQAVKSGTLTRAGLKAASQLVTTVPSDGLFGEYKYGAVSARDPQRSATIFKVNPAASIGLEVVVADVLIPAAQSYAFSKR
ncbi:MAG: ABC transporter substrate-binding protein [Cytophagaceae bacterium]|nr:ABC transporter substrate-binding protein [Gemmatimonadaceae bacterium]